MTRSFPRWCSVPPALHAWWVRADPGSIPLQHLWTTLGGHIFNEGLRPLRGGYASSSTYEIFLLLRASIRPWTIPQAPRPTCLEGPVHMHFLTHHAPLPPSVPHTPCLPHAFLGASLPQPPLLLLPSACTIASRTGNPAILLASVLVFTPTLYSAETGPALRGPLIPACAGFQSWGLLPLLSLLPLLACVITALSCPAPMPMLPWTALDMSRTQPKIHVPNPCMLMAAPLCFLSSFPHG